MKNIKQAFEKIHQKFALRKKNFKKVIEGNPKKYSHLNQLLSDAEILDAQLQGNLVVVTADGCLDQRVLRNKIKTLRKIVRELDNQTKPVWCRVINIIIIALVVAVFAFVFIRIYVRYLS